MGDVDDYLENARDVHDEKDADYGAAWRTVGEIMHIMAGEDPVTLESPEDWASVGLYWERLIKIQRAFNGEFVASELNFESIEDSHTDNINYAAMHAALRGDSE